jgi:hypothetical protein
MGTLLLAMLPQLFTVGQRMPPLHGEFLTGRKAVLPDAAEGRVSLLLLGFTYESRYAVEAWAERFRHQFGADPRVGFYEIPIIGGVSKLAKWFIDGGMRRGTPKADHEHVITVYSGASEWKRRVGYRNPKAAHLILLDAKGNVAWRYNGPFDDAAYRELAAKVETEVAPAPQF